MYTTFCESKTRWLCTRRVRRWARRSAFRLYVVWLDKTLLLHYHPATGFQPASLYRGRGGRGDLLAEYPVQEPGVKRKSPHVTAGQSGPSHAAPIESNMLHQCPSLLAHCAVLRYDDGEPRKPGWWTVKTLGVAWVVQVKDPDSCCSLTVTAQTLDDALVLAELMLSAEDAPWEPDPWLKRSESGKKK